MSYVVLARKWRPQSFEDLVGQEHVSTTLTNAIARDRVAHAFLFTGVRGVGKTTSARILAKALSCVKGPTATPCQTCPACTEITVGTDVDVQEIDGASYTGVDDVRELQKNIPFRPARDRYKIYIVDEVHMLSMNAWNAFLKTLEEPPPHVKFIFATTEVHKVPVTILSRCQRYDFKLISALTIAARLKHVLSAEGIAADDGAIAVIAREAAGSMRDAMSLLDQVIAWVGVDGERLTAEGVSRVLGIADRQVLHRLATALVEGDAPTCLSIVGEIAGEGYDIPHVAKNILSHLRDLTVAKVCETPDKLLDLAPEEIADIAALAGRTSADDLIRLHQGFSKSFDDIVRGGQPRASLEMTLLRLARRPPLLPVDELLRRLSDLERRIGGGASGAPSGNAPGAGPGPAGPPRRPSGGARADGAPTQRAEFAPPQRAESPPAPRVEFAPPQRAESPPASRAEFAPPQRAESAPAPRAESAPVPRPGPRPEPPAFRSEPPPMSRPDAPPPRRPSFPPPAEASPASAPASHNAAQSAPPSPPVSSRPQMPSLRVPATPMRHIPKEDVARWRRVIETVRARRPALASVLSHAQLFEITDDHVTIAYEKTSFLSAQATESGAAEMLSQAVAQTLGADVQVRFEIAEQKGMGPTIADIESHERLLRKEAARREVENHPLVQAAIQSLGADLLDIRLADADAH